LALPHNIFKIRFTHDSKDARQQFFEHQEYEYYQADEYQAICNQHKQLAAEEQTDSL
jgi:hypothetical protein